MSAAHSEMSKCLRLLASQALERAYSPGGGIASLRRQMLVGDHRSLWVMADELDSSSDRSIADVLLSRNLFSADLRSRVGELALTRHVSEVDCLRLLCRGWVLQ